MTKEKKIRKLTDIQREILEALRDGAVITVDRHNMAWLGDRPVQPQTRYFLTDNRLITRLDKKRSVESKGNGFVISEKGLAVLDEQPSRKKSSFHRKSKQERPVEPEPPTERQLNYTKDLGINIPQDATKSQVSDMISARLNRDKSATDRHRSFADLYGVQYTKYTGKRDLFERIYSALSRPDHEEELVSWFVFRVYRNLVKGAEDVSIASPNHAIISDIAKQLISDDSVMRSIQRYDRGELIWFGEWTAPDGTYHTGGSKRTVAYKKAASLLSDKLELESRSSRTRNYANRGQSTSDELSISVNKGTTGRGGCLSVVIFVGVITIAMIGTVVWVINLS